MNPEVKAAGLLLLTALLWSFGGVLIKSVDWNPMAIAGMRSALSIPVLVVAFRGWRIRWAGTHLVGALFYAATVIMFVVSNRMTTAANAILLQYTAPVYVAIAGAWLLGERARWFDWAAIAAAIGGMALFFLDDLSFESFRGSVISLVNGVTFAFLIVMMRKQKDRSPEGSVILGNILTALVCLPFMFRRMPGAASWVSLGLLGFFQIGLAYVCFATAIRTATALQAIMIPLIEPVLNPIWVFLVIGERPGEWAVPGGAIVILSVAGRALARYFSNSSTDKEEA
jgi:drug/metabolite transporter (DMT)-like permease